MTRAHWRPALAWTLVVPLAAWAVLRGLGLERGYPLVPLVAFTPYAAVLSVAPPAIALLLRQRAAALAALVAAAVLVAGVAPRALPNGVAEIEGPSLRVLTVNLLVGRADAGELVDLVRRERVDVLSVQELETDSVAALDRAGLSALLPHRHTLPASRGEGGGIYSRFPLEPRPTAVPGSPLAMPTAVVQVPGAAAVEVVAVHALPPVDDLAIARWAADLRGLPRAGPPGPVRILAGDFNATLDHRALRAVLARGYADAAAADGAGWVPTFPGQAADFPPPVTIDHILVDRRAAIGDVSVHDLPGSDHRPVLVELGLPPSETSARRR